MEGLQSILMLGLGTGGDAVLVLGYALLCCCVVLLLARGLAVESFAH
jgi:hypothetical protein